MTNDMIIAAYQELEQQIKEKHNDFEKIMHFSHVVRKVACFILLFAAITGLICALTLKKEWYFVILFTLGAFLTAVLLCGIGIFLLKPLFFFHRKKAKKLHQTLFEKEQEQQSLELLFLDENIPDPLPYEKAPLYLHNTNRIKLKTVFQRYRSLIQETNEAKQHLRVCLIEHQKNREWLWFGFALMILLLAVAIIIAIFALYFLFVFLFITVFIALVVGWIASRREYYAPIPMPNSDYDPQSEHPSLLDRIFTATIGVFFTNDDVSKEAMEKATADYTRLIGEKEELFDLMKPYVPGI